MSSKHPAGRPSRALSLTVSASLACAAMACGRGAIAQDGLRSFVGAVRDVPARIGATFAQQAVMFDTQANAAGPVVSQATRGVIGRP